MPTAVTILAELKSKGKENTRKIYVRHDMGETACKIPLAAEYIEKVEAARPHRPEAQNHPLLAWNLRILRHNQLSPQLNPQYRVYPSQPHFRRGSKQA
jgi:hypothetical protein